MHIHFQFLEEIVFLSDNAVVRKTLASNFINNESKFKIYLFLILLIRSIFDFKISPFLSVMFVYNHQSFHYILP